MKKASSVFIVSLATLVLFEFTLQLIAHYGKNTNNLLVAIAYNKLFGKGSWEEYFLENYRKGDLVYQGLYRPDKNLGWSLKPSFNQVQHGKNFSSNAQGYRALADFKNEPEKYQVLIFGDSFTFGDDISDEITWPHLLSQKDSRLNVLNMAGSGYGTDQMLLTLEKEIERYSPDLIIAAFISDDLYRSTIGFRDFKKPRFKLNGHKLELVNTPIGTLDEVAKEAELSTRRFPVQMLNVWFHLSRKRHPMEKGPCNPSCFELNQAIFQRMSSIANEHRADFLMIYLPTYPETIDLGYSIFGEVFFDTYQKTNGGYYLNPRAALVAAPFEKSRGHYKISENALISELVYGKIKTTPSWITHVNGSP